MSTPTKVRGVLYPGGLLTAEAVMSEIGIGRNSLRRARQSGIVKRIQSGTKSYYRTTELIEWIEADHRDRTRLVNTGSVHEGDE